MTVDTFDTFEYDKTPDYLSGFDRRVKEEDASRALIESQMKDNDRQREANRKSNARVYDQLQNLAPKAAKYFAQRAQAQDEEYEARLSVLINKSGFTWDQYNEYNKDDSDNLDIDKLGIEMSAKHIESSKAEGADVSHHLALAEQWRGLSGRDIKRIGGLSLMRQANQIDTLFYSVRDQLQLPDGTTWSGADPIQKQELWDEFLVKYGAKGTLPFKDIFREKKFWETVNQKKTAIFATENTKFLAGKVVERQVQNTEILFEAAQNTSENFYNSFNEAVNSTWSDYNSANEVLGKRAAALFYVGKIESEIIAGNLPVSAYENLIKFKVQHKDGRGEVTYGSILDRQVGYSTEEKLVELKEAAMQKKTEERKDEATNLAFEIDGLIEEHGGRLQEAEAQKLVNKWKKRFGDSQPVPNNLKYQLANSVQDYDDRALKTEIIAAIKDPLIRPDRNRALLIQNDTLRSEVLNLIEADRIKLTQTQLNDVESSFTKIVKEKLNLDLGQSGDTIKAEEMTTYAVYNYLKYYNEGRNQYDSHEAIHEKAYQRVKEEINSGDLNKDPRNIDTSNRYSKKMEAIREYRTKNPEKFLTKGLIPNTKEDFDQLEKWVANPRANNWPGLYREMARRYPAYTVIPGSGVRRPLTGYEWAQIQYKAVTGKELPPITGRVKEVINNPNWASFLNTPNSRTEKQGNALDNNTINDEENLTDGLTLEGIA